MFHAADTVDPTGWSAAIQGEPALRRVGTYRRSERGAEERITLGERAVVAGVAERLESLFVLRG